MFSKSEGVSNVNYVDFELLGPTNPPANPQTCHKVKNNSSSGSQSIDFELLRNNSSGSQNVDFKLLGPTNPPAIPQICQKVNNLKLELKPVKRDEQKALEIFADLMKDPETSTAFLTNGYIKLSRTKYKSLNSSYIIRFLGPSKDPNSALPKYKPDNLHVFDIKPYEYIHGSNAKLGEGGEKIAKSMKGEPSDLVIARFKSKDIESSFPEMPGILKEVKGLPFISAGDYFVITSQSKKSKGKRKVVIFSEFARTNLDKLIQTTKNLSIRSKLEFALQILTGVKELHKKGIAHRDIKLSNINIITDSKTGQDKACLADMDYAVKTVKPGVQSGSKPWQPPEILKGKAKKMIHLQRGDVFATGMCLHEMFYGKHVWFEEGVSTENDLKEFKKKYKRRFSKCPEPKENTLGHLIWKMIHPEPLKRPKAKVAAKCVEAFLQQFPLENDLSC